MFSSLSSSHSVGLALFPSFLLILPPFPPQLFRSVYTFVCVCLLLVSVSGLCLSVSNSLCVHLFIALCCVCLCLSLALSLYLCVSVCLWLSLAPCLSLHLSLSVCVCLSVCPSLSPLLFGCLSYSAWRECCVCGPCPQMNVSTSTNINFINLGRLLGTEVNCLTLTCFYGIHLGDKINFLISYF